MDRHSRRQPLRLIRTIPAACLTVVLATTGLLTGCMATGDGDRGSGSRQATSGHSPSATGPGTPSPPSAATTSWQTHPTSIAALGDSITRGFDACSLLSDCPADSWATGTRPGLDSLAGRLLDGAAGRSWNFATTGARMADLRDQAAKAAGRRPELVTVLMGANDACAGSLAAMTPVARFRAQFGAALDTLHQASPTTEVYVASIPDLLRLWAVGRHNPLAHRVWKLGICPSMLAGADDTGPAAQTRRDAVRDRVMAYNHVLATVCATVPRCRYDGGAVFGYPFGPTELSSWDWFHPSAQGQAQLARLAYRNVTRRTDRRTTGGGA